MKWCSCDYGLVWLDGCRCGQNSYYYTVLPASVRAMDPASGSALVIIERKEPTPQWPPAWFGWEAK